MAKIKSISFCLFLLATTVFSGQIVKKGYGKAAVGANQTETDVEEFALLRAQSDAMTKIGSYVESNLQVTKNETGNRETETSSQTLSRLAVGLIKMIEGTKKMRKVVDSSTQVTLIEVKADFQIDEDDFKNAVDAIVSRKNGADDLKSKIEQFSKAEQELLEIDQTEIIENSSASRIMEKYRSTQKDVANGVVKLNSEQFLGNLGKAIDERKAGIKAYLKNISDIGGPAEIYKTSAIGEPKIEDIDGETFKVTAEFKIEESDIAKNILQENFEKFKGYLYPNGEPDYVTKKIKKPIIWFPLALCFIDGSNRVLAYSIIRNNRDPGPRDWKWYYITAYLKIFEDNTNTYSSNEGTVFDKIIGLGTPDPDGRKSSFLELNKVTFQSILPKKIVEESKSVRALFVPEEGIKGYEYKDKLKKYYSSTNYDKGAFSTQTYIGGTNTVDQFQVGKESFGNEISNLALGLEPELITEKSGSAIEIEKNINSNRPKTSDLKIDGKFLFKSASVESKATQKNKLKIIFSEFSNSYFKIFVGRSPEIITNPNDASLVDVKVSLTAYMDTQSVQTFLRKMDEVAEGESHEVIRIGKEEHESKIFEDNRLWMAKENHYVKNKQVLKLVAGNEVIRSQELTFLVETHWDDLLNPHITWIAKRPIEDQGRVYVETIAEYNEQQMCDYPGKETYFVFFNVPISQIQKMDGVKFAVVK